MGKKEKKSEEAVDLPVLGICARPKATMGVRSGELTLICIDDLS
jgi:hypothetical protein